MQAQQLTADGLLGGADRRAKSAQRDRISRAQGNLSALQRSHSALDRHQLRLGQRTL